MHVGAIPARWVSIASSARLQRSSQCLSAVGSQVVIFGGELEPRKPVDNRVDALQVSLERGSAETNTLDAPAVAPSPRVGSATAVLGDSVYLFSGRGGLAMMPVEEQGALWRYTPATGNWELVKPADTSAPYPAGRSYHAMAADGADSIFVHAGCPEAGRLSDLWSFSLESRTWTELPTAPPPGRGGSSIAYSDGKLYRANGFDGKTEQGGALDTFDLRSQTWSTISYQADGIHGPEARSVSILLAVRVQGRDLLVTMFGEHDPSSLGHAGAGKMLSDIWVFDITSQQWTNLAVKGGPPAARGWFDADVARDSASQPVIIVHGGLAEDNSRLGDIWLLQFE